MPKLTLYNSNKSQTQSTYDTTSGASLETKFVAEPDDDYYLEVSRFSASAGSYKLSVLPQRAYDHYEPKDDALSATPLSVGQGVTANIMDSKDVDWYRLSAIGKSLTVSLDNRSATLRPSVSAFDSNRSQRDSQHYDSTLGANFNLSYRPIPGSLTI